MEVSFMILFLGIGLFLGFTVGLNFGLKRGQILEGLKSSRVFKVLSDKVELLEKQNDELRKGR